MKKYKVLKVFRDLKESKTYKKGQIIELANERSEEVEKKLSKLPDKYVEEIKEEDKKDKK